MKYDQREELRKLVDEFKTGLLVHLEKIEDVLDDNEDDEPLFCLQEGVAGLVDDCEDLLTEEAL